MTRAFCVVSIASVGGWLGLAAACASLKKLPPEQACLEAGYAIARRTYECTNDAELANARYEAFERQYTCIPAPRYVDDTAMFTTHIVATDTAVAAAGVMPQHLFHCAFAIEQLSCELVDAYGDELGLYLTASNACAWVVEPKQEGA